MGCNGTGSSRGVGGIIARDVNAFVGWNGYVDLSHSDQTTSVLIKALYSEKLSAEEAVQESMTIIGPDPSYKTVLECICLELSHGNQLSNRYDKPIRTAVDPAGHVA